MDADGQHLPNEIPTFLEAAVHGKGDLILGDRMGDPKGMPLGRRGTNWLMSLLLSRVAGRRIPDTQCGFRLLSKRVLEGLDLVSERFEIESELVVKAAWAGYGIHSVSVSSVYGRSSSFIHPVRDTFRFLRFLLRLKRPRASAPRVFP